VEYRIEQLAEAAKTTVRNVRAYQDRGLLPAPRRDGRVAWYSDEHLGRLRLIGMLLERGYSLGNIAELVKTWETGGDLRELLGFEVAVTSPFDDEPPATIGLDELTELFGTLDPAAVMRAVEIGLLSFDSPESGRLSVRSMRLLRAGAELHRSGVPLDALLDELQALRDDVDLIAKRFVRLMVRHVFDRLGPDMPPPKEANRLADMVRRVRPLAQVVVDAELARALERHIRTGLGDRLDKLLARTNKKRKGTSTVG
jgi:DNA-binding transcriptional MerR regulator